MDKEGKMKKKSVVILLMFLLVFTIFNLGSTVSAANGNYYWIATDGDTDPLSTSIEYIDTWTGQGLEQRIAQFQWYVDSIGTGEGVPLVDYGRTMGGTKALLSMTGSVNDWHLHIQIYKGGANNPKAGPEGYQWRIINGKDSSHDCIAVVFTDTITGKTSKVVTLYNGDVVITGIPNGAEFTCKMWLS